MNPLRLMKYIQKINSREAELGISDDASWQAKYRELAHVFVGGIPSDLTEVKKFSVIEFVNPTECKKPVQEAAKSIVANGLAHHCIVQVLYAIGVLEPLSKFVDTYGIGKIPDKRGGNGRFLKTATYGHFGRDDHDFTWEVVKTLKCAKA